MTNVQFVETDEIAQTGILLTLEDTIWFNVQNVNTTAKVLWEILHKVYEDKSLVNKIYIKIKLYNLKLKNETSINKSQK